MHDQKYQKSSKRFPLRNLPVSSHSAEAGSAPRICQRTDFMHARHFFYAGVEPAHTRICSLLSCDVFARVVSIKPWGETDLTFLLCPPPARTCHALLSATQSRMRKEFKRGKPSSFCPFRTFRTGEKYFVFHVLLCDQKYQKSSKTFPLRYLPASPRFAKVQTSYTLLCEHIK